MSAHEPLDGILKHTSEQLGALLERGMSGEVVSRYEGPIMLFIYLYYHSESAAPAIIDTDITSFSLEIAPTCAGRVHRK